MVWEEARTIRTHVVTYWPRWLLGAAVAVHLVMMASLFWGYLDKPLSDIPNLHKQGIDFFSNYESGYRARENEPLYLGSLADFYRGESPATPYSLVYRYVPVFAYGFALPLNVVRPWWAYWGWVAFNELLLVLCAIMTWRITPKGPWRPVATAMWFVFHPFYLQQYVGQFSFVMAVAVFWIGVGLMRGREIVSGVPWLVSLVTKSVTVVLAPLFLRIGWWRSLVAGAVVAAINAPYFILRTEEWDFFRRLNFTNVLTEATDRNVRFNPSEHGVLALVRNGALAFDSNAADIPGIAAVALVGVVGAASLAATFLARKPDFLALLAIWVSAYFVCAQVWEFDYVMMLPVLVLLVALRPAVRPLALGVFVLVALPTPFLLLNHLWNTGPVPVGLGVIQIQNVWPAWGVIFYHSVKSVPVAVLWAYLLVSQLRQGVDAGYVADAWTRVRKVARPVQA